MFPRRFILSGSQMSEGFAAAECFPAHSEFFAGLTVARGVLPPLLAGAGEKLDPTARAVFETIARPDVSLRFLSLAEGSGVGLETRIVGNAEGTFVALARPDPDHWDIALLGERELALAFVDELLGASGLAATGRDFSISLTLAQLALLAATAQLVRLEELRAKLGRKAAGLEFLFAPLAVKAIAYRIAAEKKKPDLGSPITRLAIMCEGALFGVLEGDALEAGLADLIDSGLADANGALVADGLALVALLKSHEVITLVQSAKRSGDEVTVDTLHLMHGPGSLITGAWRKQENGDRAGIVLSAMRGVELLELIDLRMGPLILRGHQELFDEGGGFCQRCGTLYEKSPKFCRECGVAL